MKAGIHCISGFVVTHLPLCTRKYFHTRAWMRLRSLDGTGFASATYKFELAVCTGRRWLMDVACVISWRSANRKKPKKINALPHLLGNCDIDLCSIPIKNSFKTPINRLFVLRVVQNHIFNEIIISLLRHTSNHLTFKIICIKKLCNKQILPSTPEHLKWMKASSNELSVPAPIGTIHVGTHGLCLLCQLRSAVKQSSAQGTEYNIPEKSQALHQYSCCFDQWTRHQSRVQCQEGFQSLQSSSKHRYFHSSPFSIGKSKQPERAFCWKDPSTFLLDEDAFYHCRL